MVASRTWMRVPCRKSCKHSWSPSVAQKLADNRSKVFQRDVISLNQGFQAEESSESIRAGSADPFLSVPMEVTSMVLEYLSSKDIASLRFATRAVRQVPQLMFRRLLLEDMPWMWEVEQIKALTHAGWNQLYCAIKFDWIGLKGLQNRKRIWKDAEHIVRRIGQYKSDMDLK